VVRGKSKPTFKSLLKLREFLGRQPKMVGGIEPLWYAPIRGNNRMGGKGSELVDIETLRFPYSRSALLRRSISLVERLFEAVCHLPVLNFSLRVCQLRTLWYA
jgi:hypothetical protein